MTLLQNQYERERTQILAILMLAMQNIRRAGYMLTGIRSMLLDADGSGYIPVRKCCRLWECLINAMIEYRSCLNGLIYMQILLPAKRIISHPRQPIWVTTQKCFNSISTMKVPGIKFYLIQFRFLNHWCSSHLKMAFFLSYLLSTESVLAYILPSKFKPSGIILSRLQLTILS